MADYKKQDYWQQKAKTEGFPARSVYKLIEINEKFSLIKPKTGIRILDLGAAPGSWSLYILRKFPGCFLVSVDISPLSHQFDNGLFEGKNFCFIQGDFTDSAVHDNIISQEPFNLILSDAAPSTTGNRLIDTTRSLELAETVVSYATNALASKGNLVIKLFQGSDSPELLKSIRSIFNSAKSYKPTACRSDSFETYFIGLGKS